MTEKHTPEDLQENEDLNTDDTFENENIDTPDDTSDEDFSNITIEDYQKEKLARKKAEQKLVELKRANKELKNKEPKGDFVSKSELALSQFLANNPEMQDFEKELSQYQSKGLSLKQAKILIENSDETKERRAKLEKMSVSNGEGQ